MSDKLVELLDRMQNEDADQRLANEPRKKRWRSVPRDTGEFLGVMARATHSKSIVEFGTSHGYSTIWLGLAAKSIGGKVISFEIEEWRYKQATLNIEEAGLQDVVTLHLGNPLDNLNLIPNNIDLLFLDSEKEEYLKQIIAIFSKIKPGGSIIADNIISHFADLREYIEFVRTHNELNSVLFSSIGNGMELTYKLGVDEMNDIAWTSLIR